MRKASYLPKLSHIWYKKDMQKIAVDSGYKDIYAMVKGEFDKGLTPKAIGKKVGWGSNHVSNILAALNTPSRQHGGVRKTKIPNHVIKYIQAYEEFPQATARMLTKRYNCTTQAVRYHWRKSYIKNNLTNV